MQYFWHALGVHVPPVEGVFATEWCMGWIAGGLTMSVTCIMRGTLGAGSMA